MVIVPLSAQVVDDAARLMAREHHHARDDEISIPPMFLDPKVCRDALLGLLTDEFSGVIATDASHCVGVMCGRTFDDVGFVPAHGLAVDPEVHDPTRIVVPLFAELAPILLAQGAVRFTIDHVARPRLGVALHDVGFGRGSVFAVRATDRIGGVASTEVRVGEPADLDTIAALSHIELLHRSTPPMYASQPPCSIAETRNLHERLHEQGAIHLLARRDGVDVGLLTIERSSPAPRLCPANGPYIGPTATHPSARHRGIGRALVAAAVDWAQSAGHDMISVDFDSANPLSRPFWLGLAFRPTGYRVRRVIDARHQPGHDPT